MFKNRDMKTTRRLLLSACASLPLFAIATRRAWAAEFNYKLATGQDPTHPVNVRAQEAIDRIREATGGRLEIKLFPANQLGSDTDLLNSGSERQRRVPEPVLLDTCHLRAGRRDREYRFCFHELRCSLASDGRRSRNVPPNPNREDADHCGIEDLGQRIPSYHVIHPGDQNAG